MKISTHLMFDRASHQMSTAQTNLAKSQAQLAQGKQIINPSDAPDQASTVQRLKSILGFGYLPKRDKQSIRSWLEGKLLVALLLEALLVKGESFFPWGYPLQTIKGA